MNDYNFWNEYLKKIKKEILNMCRKKDKLHIDLHIHSNYSADGKQSISQILKSTKKKGFDIISITDHDSLNAYDEIYNYVKDGLTTPIIIPGIEFTIDNREYGNQCHLLQLFVNPKDKIILNNIELNYNAMFNRSKIQFTRLSKNQAITDIFKQNKINISYEEYKKFLYDNEMIPEYDTLCLYLIDKIKSRNITTFDILDKLEKYNLSDCYEDRQNIKEKRYKQLRDKYKKTNINLYNPRFLLSMLAVKEVDDDWWEIPCGSLSVNSYGQLKVEQLNDKYSIFFAHPTEKSLNIVEKIINKKKSIIGLELNYRCKYNDINNFYKLLENKKLLKVIGSDSHDDSLQFYDDIKFYEIDAIELKKIINKVFYRR